jgi:hypothetical protein
MRDDIPDTTLKIALSNGMQGPRRDRVPAMVARNPELMRRLVNILAYPHTFENWGFLVQLYDAASAIVAAKEAAATSEEMLMKEMEHG